MQLDKQTLQKLLLMNDRQLASVIRSLAENSGLDLSTFNIHPDDIQSIRKALSGATDEDLARAADQLRDFKKGSH